MTVLKGGTCTVTKANRGDSGHAIQILHALHRLSNQSFAIVIRVALKVVSQIISSDRTLNWTCPYNVFKSIYFTESIKSISVQRVNLFVIVCLSVMHVMSCLLTRARES
jgi:hypothetical protein